MSGRRPTGSSRSGRGRAVVRDGDPDRRWRPRRFAGLTVATGLTLGFTAPLTAVLAIQLGASAFLAGLIVASLSAVVLGFDVLGTRALPHLEPRRAITVGLLLWAAGSFATAVTPNVEVMTAARLVQGVGLALQAAAAPQVALRSAGPGRIGQALGRFQAAMTLGSSVAPLTGGAVAAIGVGTTGPRLAFAVCGGLALAAAAFAWVIVVPYGSAVRPRVGLPRLPGMRTPRALVALAVGATGQGLRAAIALTVVPILAAEHLGLIGWRIGAFLTVLSVVEATTMAVVGPLSDRHGRRPAVLIGVGSGVAGLMIMAGSILDGSVLLFAVTAVPLGLAGGCMLGLLPAVLVDLAGGPEIGLAATRISRDLGFTTATVAAGAAIALGGAVGALGLTGCLFVAVAVGILAVGETRVRPVVPAPTVAAG